MGLVTRSSPQISKDSSRREKQLPFAASVFIRPGSRDPLGIDLPSQYSLDNVRAEQGKTNSRSKNLGKHGKRSDKKFVSSSSSSSRSRSHSKDHTSKHKRQLSVDRLVLEEEVRLLRARFSQEKRERSSDRSAYKRSCSRQHDRSPKRSKHSRDRRSKDCCGSSRGRRRGSVERSRSHERRTRSRDRRRHSRDRHQHSRERSPSTLPPRRSRSRDRLHRATEDRLVSIQKSLYLLTKKTSVKSRSSRLSTELRNSDTSSRVPTRPLPRAAHTAASGVPLQSCNYPESSHHSVVSGSLGDNNSILSSVVPSRRTPPLTVVGRFPSPSRSIGFPLFPPVSPIPSEREDVVVNPSSVTLEVIASENDVSVISDREGTNAAPLIPNFSFAASALYRETADLCALHLLEEDFPVPPAIKSRSQSALSLLALGQLAEPRGQPVLAHPTLFRKRTLDRLDGLSESLSGTGKMVSRSTLDETKEFPANDSLVPRRVKLKGNELLSNSMTKGKIELDFLTAQEKGLLRVLHSSLHCSTAVSCAFKCLEGTKVSPDVDTLLKSTTLLVDALAAELAVLYANNTLRQRDILLKDTKLPKVDSSVLRKLPLFEKDIFPTDLDKLSVRLAADQQKLDEAKAFSSIAASLKAKTTVVQKAAAPTPSPKQPPQGQAQQGRGQHTKNQRGKRQANRGRGKPYAPSTAQKPSFRPGASAQEKK
jgi:hypothetical protein